MGRKFTLGPDDDTPVTLPDGTVLDGEAAEAFARAKIDEARRRGLIPGRKSLTGGSVHSPVLQVRLPEQVHDELVARARDRGVPVSRVARELIESALRAS